MALNKKGFTLLVAAWLLSAPVAARAQQSINQVIDGGTCIPYPQYRATSPYMLNFQHYLMVFGGTAFCHLTVSSDWPFNSLQYVLFTGWSQQVVTARLCVHSGEWAVTCGQANTISGPLPQYSFVVPPPQLPPGIGGGAFVRFDFPPNSGSGVTMLWPWWYKEPR